MLPLESAASTTLPQISGYSIVEQLYKGSRTAVFRAMQLAQQRPVVIKLLRQEYPSFSELVQFRNQYTIAKNLDIPGIVSPYSLERYGNGYALVMEDFGAVSLGKYAQQQRLDWPEVLAIALQMADILHELCQHRVVHKDIKPANILIHPGSKQIKLIDFSIASLLPKETQEIQNPNVLEGTLAYLAPEQTGRMNRGIDYRADFYGLGITLYELLTGELPFQSEDPLELVHCHIAQHPVPPHQLNPAIPLMVSAIALKLMAKNAEDRYQSALGLKHDLEQCLTQWAETKAIAEFALGQRDVSDRFLIPEKLYGRAAEVKTILDAFDRVANGNSEIMLVAGFSGIGKTAVVNEVHKPITRQHGYFIKGKFDQFNRNIPLSAFVQTLRDLMGQLLSESDAQLAKWRAKMLQVVGENGQVLIEVIPELEQIVGTQPPAPELSGPAAQSRFNLLFQKFIGVVATAEHPLVIFLDDLQWADAASLQLIKLLMGDQGHLLLLGAYRDNEVSPVHPFVVMVKELKQAKAIVNTTTLAPLAFRDTNQLVADTLNCSTERSQPLAELIVRKTQGNPFFTTQFLKALHEDGQITFDRRQGYWDYDLAQVNALSLTDDVVEFMAQQLQKLPAATQQVLKLAACIGNQFDLETLAIISEQSQISAAQSLWKALQEGLVLPTSQTYKVFHAEDASQPDADGSINLTYRFLHDRVQQAAYDLIPENHKRVTHLTIGRRLLQNTPDLESNLFEIANHWNIAIDLIDAAAEIEQLARLNWLAGLKAKASVAYEPALQYFKTGLDLLAADSWQTQYELTLNLHEGAAKTAFICGDYLQMEQWSEIILQRSKTVLDQVKMYDVRVQAQMAQAKPAIAIEIALTALKLLNITLPDAPTAADIQNELQKTEVLWADQDIMRLADLPLMSDPEKIAAIIILSSIFAPSFIAKPEILPLIACQQIQLSIQYGNCEHSAFGYSNYSAILSTLCHNLDASYEFGKLAIHLVEKLNAKEVKARTFNQAAIFSMHGKVHLREAPPILQEGCQSGVENGDLEFAGYAAYNWSQYSYFSGLNLSELQVGAQNYGLLLSQINQKISLVYNQLIQQAALNLLGRSPDPCRLTGQVFDEQKALQLFRENQVFSGIQYLFVHKTVLCCLFGNFEQVLDYVDQAEYYLSASTGMIMVPAFHFFATLARLQVCATKFPHEQAQLMAQIDQGFAEIGQWAEQAPMNFQHKFDLMTAERSRLLGKPHLAADFYDRAISGAKDNGYIQEESLANELAAKFYLDRDKDKIAASYMQEAYAGYARWGAKAKTDDLENRYPNLLWPILQGVPQSLNPLETLATIATPNLSIHGSTAASHSSSNNSINTALDFAAVLKASQALSGTIQLDELLRQLTQIILQNSGGDRCALIRRNSDDIWRVEAIATSEITELCAEPLEGNPNLPVKLIQYVKNTKEVVAIDNLKTDLPVVGDYLTRHQPKSVLCLPILNQGQLIAILYLRNQSTSGVFTRDRILILNFLCTQAAISLENARLYEQAQAYAKQLEQSQLQIVQNEKMASLGNLVAGIAHEINNPIGFLNGSIKNAKDYVADLLDYLALYEQHHPNAAAPVQQNADDIDLEFVREDLPKLLNSMKGATDRIKSISVSLRTFSRADTEYAVSANLHDGLDSTLLILKYRLNANEHRPAIEVIQDYGELPHINCFPGQLNQVFMNILANAIDMFDEAAQHASHAELEANPQTITIKTARLAQQNAVEIRIGDNGKGMSAEVKAKIFDHLFTTKGVGKGTGLGLAIARQIVVEKHKGEISVDSTLGQGTEFCIRLPIAA